MPNPILLRRHGLLQPKNAKSGGGTKPSVTNVNPISGPATGATSVTVTGTQYANATQVYFGSTPAASFTVNTPTQITAVSPAESASTVDITVQNPYGTSPTSTADRFTFTAVGALPRVMVIFMESMEYSIFFPLGSGAVNRSYYPNIATWAGEYPLLTNFWSAGHPSKINYLTFWTGWGCYSATGVSPGSNIVADDSNPGVSPDGAEAGNNNLGEQLSAANIPWFAYMDALGTANPQDDSSALDAWGSALYQAHHNPAAYYNSPVPQNYASNSASHIKDFTTYFNADLTSSSPPQFMFIAPRMDHNMHDPSPNPDEVPITGPITTAISTGDSWLQGLLLGTGTYAINGSGGVMGSSWWNNGGIVIIVWDEAGDVNGDDVDSTNGGGMTGGSLGTLGPQGGQIPGIVMSKALQGDTTAFSSPISHAGILRGVEEYFSLPLIGDASTTAYGDLYPLLSGSSAPALFGFTFGTAAYESTSDYGPPTHPASTITNQFPAWDTWADIQSSSESFISGVGSQASSGLQLLLSLGLVPGTGGTMYSWPLSSGDQSSLVSTAQALGAAAMSAGQPNAIFRIGYEFNGGYFPWSIFPANWTSTLAADFAAAFVLWVENIRIGGGSGQNFKFDWCNSPGNGSNIQQAYPGNAYVDYLGCDAYDQDYTYTPNNANTDSATTWSNILGYTYDGLTALVTATSAGGYAAGKKVSIPEWSCWYKTDDHGLGDDPTYIQNMYTFITTASNNVGYACYFSVDEAGDGTHSLTNTGATLPAHGSGTGYFPNALAMFKSLWG